MDIDLALLVEAASFGIDAADLLPPEAEKSKPEPEPKPEPPKPKPRKPRKPRKSVG